MKEFNDDIKLPRIELEAEHVDDGKFNVEELLNMKEFTNAYPAMPCYGHAVVVPPRRESCDDVRR
jgi:hypothetical protein